MYNHVAKRVKQNRLLCQILRNILYRLFNQMCGCLQSTSPETNMILNAQKMQRDAQALRRCLPGVDVTVERQLRLILKCRYGTSVPEGPYLRAPLSGNYT